MVKSDDNTASAKAKDLQTAINEVKMEKLAKDVHMVWMKVVNKLKEDAAHINSTKNIEQQRGHFTTLSASLYELIKVAKPNTTVYVDHCPMYNDGKGANWLTQIAANLTVIVVVVGFHFFYVPVCVLQIFFW